MYRQFTYNNIYIYYITYIYIYILYNIYIYIHHYGYLTRVIHYGYYGLSWLFKAYGDLQGGVLVPEGQLGFY